MGRQPRRRIDLLCLDKNANWVVVELKRTEDGGAMEQQAIRCAAMVSTSTLDRRLQKCEFRFIGAGSAPGVIRSELTRAECSLANL